jgi:hypothetical protein
MSQKYPRTPHLPWSPGGTNDDRRLTDVEHLLVTEVVVTEKMDGSNVCLESNAVFARSHMAAPKHPSFDALKALHGGIKHKISTGTQVFGEWCYARHSIEYTALPNYLMIFGVRTNGQWASWDNVRRWSDSLGLPTVPVLFQTWAGAKTWFGNTSSLRAYLDFLAKQPSACGGEREGLVVRLRREFSDDEFQTAVAKWVRKDHVQTDDHWSSQAIIRNRLRAA